MSILDTPQLRVNARHVTDRNKDMLGFDSFHEAIAAVEKRGGHVLAETPHAVLYSDFPVKSIYTRPIEIPHINLTSLLQR